MAKDEEQGQEEMSLAPKGHSSAGLMAFQSQHRAGTTSGAKQNLTKQQHGKAYSFPL